MALSAKHPRDVTPGMTGAEEVAAAALDLVVLATVVVVLVLLLVVLLDVEVEAEAEEESVITTSAWSAFTA